MSRKHKQIPIELKLPPPLAGTCCTTGSPEAGCWRWRRRYTSVCIYEYIMYTRVCNVCTSNTSKFSFRGMILKALLPHQSPQPFWHAPRQIATKVFRRTGQHILPVCRQATRLSQLQTWAHGQSPHRADHRHHKNSFSHCRTACPAERPPAANPSGGDGLPPCPGSCLFWQVFFLGHVPRNQAPA